ncbi:MAG: DNA polymerase III subunit beta, partial [Hyphomicrobiaceae bacterium]
MKLSLSREQLLSPLQSVIGAVERKQTMPTLECVLLEAEGDSFTLTATNLEMQMRATMELPAKEGGFCVHARKLFDILRALPDKATIELNHADSRLVIKSGKSRFQLATLPAGNFPVFAIDGDSVEFSVESADLRRALEKAASAQARDDVRYYLNGVCLRLAGAQMRAIASDGHRLAYCDIALSEAVEVTQEFILPRRSVLELLKLLPGDEQILTCHLHSRTFMVDLPGLSFSTKLLEGKFPDENRVIPRDFDAEFAIDRDTLSSLVGRAAILADEKIPLIRLEL